MTRKTCHLYKSKMRFGVRSWEITHEPGPGCVTPAGEKKEPQGEEGGKLTTLNVVD